MILKIFVFVIFLIYINVTIKAQRKISSTILLSLKQKIINSIMIWLLPFIWYYLIKQIIESNDDVMVKKERKKLIKKSGGYIESWGGGQGLDL